MASGGDPIVLKVEAVVDLLALVAKRMFPLRPMEEEALPAFYSTVVGGDVTIKQVLDDKRCLYTLYEQRGSEALQFAVHRLMVAFLEHRELGVHFDADVVKISNIMKAIKLTFAFVSSYRGDASFSRETSSEVQ